MHPKASTSARVTGYVYGALIVLALLVSLDDNDPPRALDIALIVLATIVTLALAHTHAAVAGQDYDQGRRVTWRAALRESLDSWPILASGAVPAAVFLLAAADAISLRFAFDASQALVCISLFVIGYGSRRRSGGSLRRSLATGAIDLAFGLVIVALKLLVH